MLVYFGCLRFPLLSIDCFLKSCLSTLRSRHAQLVSHCQNYAFTLCSVESNCLSHCSWAQVDSLTCSIHSPTRPTRSHVTFSKHLSVPKSDPHIVASNSPILSPRPTPFNRSSYVISPCHHSVDSTRSQNNYELQSASLVKSQSPSPFPPQNPSSFSTKFTFFHIVATPKNRLLFNKNYLFFVEIGVRAVRSFEWLDLSCVIVNKLLFLLLRILKSFLLKNIVEFPLLEEFWLQSLIVSFVISFYSDNRVHLSFIFTFPNVCFRFLLRELFRQSVILSEKLRILFKNFINFTFDVFGFLRFERSKFEIRINLTKRCFQFIASTLP